MSGAGHIRLVADPYPPYQFWEGGRVIGLDCDLIQEVLRSLGFEVEVELLSWEECLEWMDRGAADGIFQIAKTPERERKYVFPSEPLRIAETVLFTRADAGVEIDSQVDLSAQLRPLKVGLLAGYSYGFPLDSLPSPPAVYLTDQEQLILALSRGELDLAAMDLGVGRFLTRKFFLPNLVPVKGFSLKRTLYVAFHPARWDLANAFAVQLRALKEQGLPEALQRRYGLI